jgi:hypothetical protein
VSTFRYDATFQVNRAKWFDRLLSIIYGSLFEYDGHKYYIIFMLNGISYPVDIDSANSALLKSIVQTYLLHKVDKFVGFTIDGLKVTGNLVKVLDGKVIANLQPFQKD